MMRPRRETRIIIELNQRQSCSFATNFSLIYVEKFHFRLLNYNHNGKCFRMNGSAEKILFEKEENAALKRPNWLNICVAFQFPVEKKNFFFVGKVCFTR